MKIRWYGGQNLSFWMSRYPYFIAAWIIYKHDKDSPNINKAFASNNVQTEALTFAAFQVSEKDERTARELNMDADKIPAENPLSKLP